MNNLEMKGNLLILWWQIETFRIKKPWKSAGMLCQHLVWWANSNGLTKLTAVSVLISFKLLNYLTDFNETE